MASTTLTLTPALKINGVIPRFGSKFNFYGGIPSDYTNPILSCSSSIKHRTTRSKPVCSAGLNRSSGLNSHTFDVVIIGAGIIGLTIARQFLLGSNLSVGIIDAAAPCAGATGAGQGYIWKVHRDPGTEKWELVMRSHQLWEALAESIHNQGLDPLQTLGWKKTGSMLVGRTANECSALKSRVEQLLEAGLEASFLSCDDLQSEEPALMLGSEGGAAFVPDDYQIDARCTVAFIEKGNRYFAAEGRYAEFYYEPATSLLRSESSGDVVAVQTSKNTLYSKKAIIVAAGCWSGSVLHDLIKHSEIELDFPVKPRKGHLLVIENFKSLNLNHGLMELGYVNHKSATLSSTTTDSGSGYDANTSPVSMTATMDMSGRLVLGSSRQLVGFNTEIDESVITQIWERAGEFFPILKQVSLKELNKSREVRVGLRPYMPDGKPVIDHVPRISNMFLAAGHEGEGLTLALGTAEMIANIVLGNPQKVDPAPYSMNTVSGV
ncbi:glycine oxidase [Olea europaea subsp. europaea]|uniref:FAD-dependent oxidoreductase domain-containing protein 1 n=2 Tax=Olea europaea subsp. europaea TaxID=158383 RepID=A0A8S0QCG4_OLEEU|nr:glycine oxidase [Olea europaea subsp. europaea]